MGGRAGSEERETERRRKISAALKGHAVSEETCRKISEVKTGRPVPVRQQKWLKEEVGYMGAHYRVRLVRGTPSLCEQCGTTDSSRFEWANLTSNYMDVNDYIRLCKSCHNAMDGIAANLNGGING